MPRQSWRKHFVRGYDMTSPDHNSLLKELEQMERSRETEGGKAQRRFERFSIRGIALVEPIRLGTSKEMQTVVLRDLSLGGLGYLSSVPLQIDTIWSIDFIDDVYRVDQQTITIRFCNKVREDAYLAGGQFCADMGLMTSQGVQPRRVFAHEDGVVKGDIQQKSQRDVA